MSSNFDFLLDSQWQDYFQTAQEAEANVYRAPAYTAMLCRRGLEEWVRWLYDNEHSLEVPYDTTLSTLIHDYRFKNLIGQQFTEINLIRKYGNQATHTNVKFKSDQALFTVKKLHRFVQWVVSLYSEERPSLSAFDSGLLQQDVKLQEKKKEELQQLEKQFEDSQSEIERLKAELEKFKAIKEENEKVVVVSTDPDEKETRRRYIDVLLYEAGWDPYGTNVPEFEINNLVKPDGTKGQGFIDYVLWGADGKPLAVVEAKRTSNDALVGKTQAKLYADALEDTYGQRPIIFFTNGYQVYLWDDTFYPEREVYGFYNRDELQLMVNRRQMRAKLEEQPINKRITDRPYQELAIRSVCEEFEKGIRKSLLVMATGTGKTRTAASMVELLSKAGWVKRVLFLADRRELVKQAKNSFNDNIPEYTAINLLKEKETDKSRITFTTYQTLMGMIDSESDNKERYFGVGHFDLIIFDEIHRTVYNKYRAIFDYFDGLKVGLTATPKDDEGQRDTYALFDRQPQDPTFAYELEEAVEQNFLVPYKPLKVPTKFHREGIIYDELSDEEKEEYEKEFADPLTGEIPEEIESTALNNWLFNEDTVKKVLATVMETGHKIEGGDQLGKSIIFCRNQKHANFVKRLFDQQFPQYKGSFCQVITYQDSKAEKLISDFKEKEEPVIAISVDMLDTGIDVPELLNLVIFKPVKSKAKFWQMIGRGTRKCEDVFGIGEHKFDFHVYDLCENFEFFSVDKDEKDATPPKSVSHRIFELKLQLSELLKKSSDETLKDLSLSMRNDLIKQVQALNTESFTVRKHLKEVEKYQDANCWKSLQPTEVRELIQEIGPLVTQVDSHEMAKRFDVMCYSFMHLLETDNPAREIIEEKIIATTERLQRKGSVPHVQSKMDLINQVSEKVFWQETSVPQVEHVREELRNLMTFLDKTEKPLAYTNFEDELGELEELETSFQTVNLYQYKKRVEHFVKNNKNNLVIDKLHRNLPITADELVALEAFLFEQGEAKSREQFEKAYGDEPLVSFVKRIVGMDTEAARKAFSEFLESGSLNTNQIRFIDMIINYLAVNGTISPDKLFEPPFTDIDSGSVMSLFDQESSTSLMNILEGLNNSEVG